MAKKPMKGRIYSKDAVKKLRDGDVETLAQCIEDGANAIFLRGLTPEQRARLVRTIRTGSPLSRSEKRENKEACLQRDSFLTLRVFYWLGFGQPGFSNTSENTAFHAAARDYESEIIRGAPARTAESLYRHVWKPYLKRAEINEYTDDDVQYSSLRAFRRGLRDSSPDAEERQKRCEWFKQSFLRPFPESALFYCDPSPSQALSPPTEINQFQLRDCIHKLYWRDRQLKELFYDWNFSMYGVLLR